MHKYTHSVEEFARAIGISRTKAYGLINEGELVARKIGNRTVILEEDLVSFLQSRKKYIDARDAKTTKKEANQ